MKSKLRLAVNNDLHDPVSKKIQPENTNRLRILWVKIGGLWPANSGGRLRSFHIIDQLSRSHDVTVYTTDISTEYKDDMKHHLRRCKKIVSLPLAAPKHNEPMFLWYLLRSWFSKLPVDLLKHRHAALLGKIGEELAGDNYDICVADFLTAVPNIPFETNIPVIYFSHNVEYMIWRRLAENQGSLVRRLLLGIEWRKMRDFEISVCQRVAATVTVSEDDCLRLLSGAPNASITAIPTGVDTTYFTPPQITDEIPHELVFSGSMDWHPNEDAMLHFISDTLPLIRLQVPGVTLSIVGRNPSALMQGVAKRAGVRVSGTVVDIRPWLARASVYVVPIRVGGGTRLKIYEALAMSRAVVSTTIGAEGLPLIEGVHIIRADNPAAFAELVVSLLNDLPRRRTLGETGRRLMQDEYSWARVARDFADVCVDVSRKRGQLKYD